MITPTFKPGDRVRYTGRARNKNADWIGYTGTVSSLSGFDPNVRVNFDNELPRVATYFWDCNPENLELIEPEATATPEIVHRDEPMV